MKVPKTKETSALVMNAVNPQCMRRRMRMHLSVELKMADSCSSLRILTLQWFHRENPTNFPLYCALGICKMNKLSY